MHPCARRVHDAFFQENSPYPMLPVRSGCDERESKSCSGGALPRVIDSGLMIADVQFDMAR